VWEDALTEGLIQVRGSAETMGQSKVILTPRGRAVLDGKSQSQVDDSDFGKERGRQLEWVMIEGRVCVAQLLWRTDSGASS